MVLRRANTRASSYHSRRAQLLRYLADRLGAVMSASLPFIFLFGARSSPLPILTGWSYRTFSIFHRWSAIVLLIEALLHGIAFSAFYVNDKTGWSNYREHLKTDSMFRSGIIMVAALFISASLAHIKVRQIAYELFKIGHIALAIVFLANYFKYVTILTLIEIFE